MDSISRRGFIHQSSVFAAGCALPLKAENALQDTDTTPKIRRYKPFGKTGWKVSDISAGSGQRDPALLEYLFECGINYVDTAYDYGNHELLVGKVLPKWRDKVFLTTKWKPDLTVATATKAQLLKGIDEQLKRLNTTYIDCLMIHGIGDPLIGDFTRTQNPAMYEAWEEAKKQGKVRFSGASGCGPTLLKEMEWGIDNNLFDVILLGANWLTAGGKPLLEKARAKGIATVAMKTMTLFKSDLNIKDLVDKNTNARQAVIKYMLSSNLYDTMIVTMRNYDQANEYLSVSGQAKLSAQDEKLLETLSAEISTKYCRPCCHFCYGSCPNNVPIASILRYKMYFENYGDEKIAMEKYKQIPVSNSPVMCTDCSAPCEKTCVHNLSIRERLLEAHTQLSFT